VEAFHCVNGGILNKGILRKFPPHPGTLGPTPWWRHISLCKRGYFGEMAVLWGFYLSPPLVFT